MSRVPSAPTSAAMCRSCTAGDAANSRVNAWKCVANIDRHPIPCAKRANDACATA